MIHKKKQVKVLNRIPTENEINLILDQYKEVEIYMRGNDIIEEITPI